MLYREILTWFFFYKPYTTFVNLWIALFTVTAYFTLLYSTLLLAEPFPHLILRWHIWYFCIEHRAAKSDVTGWKSLNRDELFAPHGTGVAVADIGHFALSLSRPRQCDKTDKIATVWQNGRESDRATKRATVRQRSRHWNFVALAVALSLSRPSYRTVVGDRATCSAKCPISATID